MSQPAQSQRAVWIGSAVLAVLVAIVAAVLIQARSQPSASPRPVQYSIPSGVEIGSFRPDAWFLPNDDLLGFVEVPGGPFLMGSDPSRDPLAFDNEVGSSRVDLQACKLEYSIVSPK